MQSIYINLLRAEVRGIISIPPATDQELHLKVPAIMAGHKALALPSGRLLCDANHDWLQRLPCLLPEGFEKVDSGPES